MKKLTVSVLAIAILSSITFFSCKKGTEDPVISLLSRKDRITNTWTLSKYEVNGSAQDISGTTYTYTVNNNGVLTQTVEGSLFGFATRSTSNGTWSFLNDDEDVKIIINNVVVIYNVQRLASKELWLKNTSGNNTYVYYFNGL